jgi:hypothetical protein
MATVTHMGVEYLCAKALKGPDYVHLLNEHEKMIVAFDGVSDFSGFSITDGDWITPTPDNECYLAVVKDDGTVGKGDHRCSDIPTKLTSLSDVVVCDSMPTSFVEGQWYLVKAEV